MSTLNDHVALVTGGGRGIGRAVALAFAAEGARVAITARSMDELNQVTHHIKETGGEAMAVCADLADRAAPVTVVKQVRDRFGPIDVLVNNAGITRTGEGEYLEEDWDATLNVNLKAPFFLSQLVAQRMHQQGGGGIINIGSIGARVGMPDNPAYQAAKGGLLQLTRAMARDWAAWNVRVNQVNPGYIHTEMSAASFADPDKHRERADRTMLGRWGTPDDLVGACLFLASDASSYMTGTDITVDGGWIAKGM